MATILVVDDDADIRMSLQWMLERAGFEVLTAGDGSDVEDTLRRVHVHVVMLDLQMPGMNGWEVIRSLKERPLPGAKTSVRPKVIVVSGRDEPETVSFVKRLGADAYAVKPLTADQVVQLVREVLVASS
ncbi:MAG TPA: response regulator [Terriglobales bacterium]|nr:response regulator [Terriglobales bacterium]